MLMLMLMRGAQIGMEARIEALHIRMLGIIMWSCEAVEHNLEERPEAI